MTRRVKIGNFGGLKREGNKINKEGAIREGKGKRSNIYKYLDVPFQPPHGQVVRAGK